MPRAGYRTQPAEKSLWMHVYPRNSSSLSPAGSPAGALRRPFGLTGAGSVGLIRIHMASTIERIVGRPEFLSVAGFRDRAADDGRPSSPTQEIVSRRRLDTRQVLPFFEHAGTLHVGVLERIRASRRVRTPSADVEPLGLEPIGFDFAGVDETGDVLRYGRAIFSERAKVEVDHERLAIALPSFARSIGYSTELALPLLLPVLPPTSATVDVAWDGAHHRILFAPVEEVRRLLRERPHAEELSWLIDALVPPTPAIFSADPAGAAFAERFADRVWDRDGLARATRTPFTQSDEDRHVRIGDLPGDALNFLALSRVREESGWFEVVTPRSGASFAVLPYVVVSTPEGPEPWFLLWNELRIAAVERRHRQPIFDVPVHPRYMNATARYLAPDEVSVDRDTLAARILGETLCLSSGGPSSGGAPVRLRDVRTLGIGEPAPSFSSELRTRVACAIDATSLLDHALPEDAIIVPARELSAAIRAGVIRDPVIIGGIVALGLDPHRDARRGKPKQRRAFLDRMTEGSVVQRRLRSYSTIETEQLESKTYARVMLLLQHEFGVRIAYPSTPEDRSFFKAAFRVFMATPREDHRELQGLHWSHDAFHFALGNFTLPAGPRFEEWFEEWFVSGAPMPESLPPEGETFELYARALKAAEDEATFFSFWTLYAEKPSLARYVGKLTYHEALLSLGVSTEPEARAIFDDVTVRATIPERVLAASAYREREDVRSLFEYMRGFRDYHLKDIKLAFKHASRDVYRGFFLRFGIYESDVDRYVTSVKTFTARLSAHPPGLNPLLALSADVRVSIALRVWDVIKAMRLLRKAVPEARRAELLPIVRATFEARLVALEGCAAALRTIRARIGDAELSPPNEETFAAIEAAAREVESLRQAIWDDAEAFSVLDTKTIEAERARELPR